MPWLKSSDALLRDPRLQEVSFRDFGVYYASELHCATYGTDGFITAKAVRTLVRLAAQPVSARAVTEALLRAGYWEQVPCAECKEELLRRAGRPAPLGPSYYLHGWLTANLTQEEWRERQADNRARQARWRDLHRERNAATNALANGAPDLTRPEEKYPGASLDAGNRGDGSPRHARRGQGPERAGTVVDAVVDDLIATAKANSLGRPTPEEPA